MRSMLSGKKKLLVSLILILVFTLVFIACSKQPSNEPADEKPAGNEPASEQANGDNNDSTGSGPRYGGIIRMISGTSPAVLGLPPEMAPGDDLLAQPCLEPLIEFVDLDDGTGGWGGILARDWETDPENKRIVFHLREGIRFHDGHLAMRRL